MEVWWLMLPLSLHVIHATLSVPPSIVHISRPRLYLIEGMELELTCTARGSPNPYVYWYKDGEMVDIYSEDNKNRMRLDLDKSLLIEEAEASDAGAYQCRAQNELGVSLSDIIQVVAVVPGVPESRPTRKRRPMYGQYIKLNCNPPHVLPGTIMWNFQHDYDEYTYEDSGDAQEFVELSDRVTMDYDGNLHFISMGREDVPGDGEFSCGVYNKVTRSITTGNMFRVRPWGDKTFKQPLTLKYASPAQVLALRGKTLKMKCIFAGNPLPRVTWSREPDIPLDTSRVEYGPGNYELTITDLNEGDVGVYVCTGRGGDDKVINRTFTVDVEAAPSWLAQPRDLSLDVGGQAEVECSGDGMPFPTQTWFINGEPVHQKSGHHHLLRRGKLVLKNVQKTDSMVVQCNVTNRHGYLWSDTYVNVLAEPARIEQDERSTVKLVRGGQADLACNVTGHPTPEWSWFKGDKKLHDGHRHKLFNNGTMRIQSASVSDQELYKCVARNKFGEDEVSFTVVIRDPTMIVLYPVDVQVRTGEDAVFRCKATTDPAEVTHLQYTWLKDNVTLDVSNPQVRRRRGELIISKVALADSALYTCVASNGIDASRASARLSVQAPPGAPGKVTMTQCTPSMANIVWKFDDSLDNFSPLRSFSIETSNNFDPELWEKTLTVPNTKTSASVPLSCYATYEFRVRAVNDVGAGVPSVPTASQCETPMCRPRSHPGGVRTVGDMTGYLVVEWEFMRQIEHNGPDFHYIVMVNKAGETTVESFIINDYFEERLEVLVEDVYQEYRVTVKAANRLGEASLPAISVLGHSSEGVPTVSPPNLTLSDDSQIAEGTVVLTWDAVDDDSSLMLGKFRGYKIRYWKADDPDKIGRETLVKMEASSTPTVSATVYNLPMYANLQADVVVVNTFYSSVPSNIINFTTPEGVPDPPEYVTVRFAGATHVMLEWGPPESINGILTGYRVTYKEITDQGMSEMVTVTETTRQRTFVGQLKPETEYRFYVWAMTKRGTGGPFYVEEMTAKLETAMTVPDIETATASDRQIDVSWRVEDSIDTRAGAYYFLEYRLLGASQWQHVSEKRTVADAFEQKVRRLHPQSTYQVRVVALDAPADRVESLMQLVNTNERLSDDELEEDYDYSSGNGTLGDDEDDEVDVTVTHNVIFLTEPVQHTSTTTPQPEPPSSPQNTPRTPAAESTLGPDSVTSDTSDGVSTTQAVTTTVAETTSERVVDIVDTDVVDEEEVEKKDVVLTETTGITGSESGDIIYVVVENGDPMDLTCRAEAPKHSKVKWYKGDDTVIRGSDNTLLVNHHRVSNSRLVVLRPKASDAGMYRCSTATGKGQYFQVSMKESVKKESCAVVSNSGDRVVVTYSVLVFSLIPFLAASVR